MCGLASGPSTFRPGSRRLEHDVLLLLCFLSILGMGHAQCSQECSLFCPPTCDGVWVQVSDSGCGPFYLNPCNSCCPHPSPPLPPRPPPSWPPLTPSQTVCSNGCMSGSMRANDGICSDGGPGSADAACALGDDCGDCGFRCGSPTACRHLPCFYQPPPVHIFISAEHVCACPPAHRRCCPHTVLRYRPSSRLVRCSNGCSYSGDGQCGDGGPGSGVANCNFGDDCLDCGPRCASRALHYTHIYAHTGQNTCQSGDSRVHVGTAGHMTDGNPPSLPHHAPHPITPHHHGHLTGLIQARPPSCAPTRALHLE